MRRLTWMRYNHRILMPEHLSEENYFADSFGKNRIDTGSLQAHLTRQPMQRTEYYMPWGVVTVDELHKMDVSMTRLFTFDEIQREWNQTR